MLDAFLPDGRLDVTGNNGTSAVAMNAAVGAGYFSDHASAVAAMSHSGLVFQPEPEHVHLYDRLYREVYTRMYPRLSGLYRSIRQITHYPKY